MPSCCLISMHNASACYAGIPPDDIKNQINIDEKLFSMASLTLQHSFPISMFMRASGGFIFDQHRA